MNGSGASDVADVWGSNVFSDLSSFEVANSKELVDVVSWALEINVSAVNCEELFNSEFALPTISASSINLAMFFSDCTSDSAANRSASSLADSVVAIIASKAYACCAAALSRGKTSRARSNADSNLVVSNSKFARFASKSLCTAVVSSLMRFSSASIFARNSFTSSSMDLINDFDDSAAFSASASFSRHACSRNSSSSLCASTLNFVLRNSSSVFSKLSVATSNLVSSSLFRFSKSRSALSI